MLAAQVRRLKMDVDKLTREARQAAGGKTDDKALEWTERARTLTTLSQTLANITPALERLVGPDRTPSLRPGTSAAR